MSDLAAVVRATPRPDLEVVLHASGLTIWIAPGPRRKGD